MRSFTYIWNGYKSFQILTPILTPISTRETLGCLAAQETDVWKTFIIKSPIPKLSPLLNTLTDTHGPNPFWFENKLKILPFSCFVQKVLCPQRSQRPNAEWSRSHPVLIPNLTQWTVLWDCVVRWMFINRGARKRLSLFRSYPLLFLAFSQSLCCFPVFNSDCPPLLSHEKCLTGPLDLDRVVVSVACPHRGLTFADTVSLTPTYIVYCIIKLLEHTN